MKKLLAGLFIFGFLAIGVQVSHACILEVGSVSCTDLTPRISMWQGKVNQHVDVASNTWQTDADGTSGAEIDKLTYCKKFYPNTTSVTEHKNETIDDWHARGNVGDYLSTKMSYECVQGAPVATPSITVVSPNGGETYKAGDQITVKWNSINLPVTTNITIGLYIDIGNNYGVKKTVTVLNSGQSVFALPNDGSGQYIIMVGDYSSRPFTITPLVADQGGDPVGCPIGSAACITSTTDKTPRISVWLGKVNQHVVAGDTYTWQTDADGVSSSDVDKLTYCKKFYPNTTSVAEYKNETINDWHARGNVGDYPSTKMSYQCVQGTITAPVVITTSLIPPGDDPVGCPIGSTSCTTSITDSAPLTQTLKVGVKGESVKTLQTFLGITADGSFGPITKATVIKWQSSNGLTPDGAFGKISRQKAGL